MAQPINITIADKVVEEVTELMKKEEKTNKSEYYEELIRCGLLYHKPKQTNEVDNNGISE